MCLTITSHYIKVSSQQIKLAPHVSVRQAVFMYISMSMHLPFPAMCENRCSDAERTICTTQRLLRQCTPTTLKHSNTASHKVGHRLHKIYANRVRCCIITKKHFTDSSPRYTDHV